MISNRRIVLYCFAFLFVLAGCRRSDGLINISGAVSYDGKPIQQGTIQFVPAPGESSPLAAAKIVDGKYSVKAKCGPKKVEIQGFNVVGRERFLGTGPEVDTLKQVLPSCYNSKSELTCEIKSGVHTYDFALEKR